VKRTSLLQWIVVATWAAWLLALRGLLGGNTELGALAPDLALVLVLALAAQLPRDDLPWLAVAAAFARVATSIDSPAAVLAGFLAVVAIARIARGVVEIANVVPRAVLAAISCFALQAWFAGVHSARLSASSMPFGGAPESGEFALALARAWPGALATGIAAALLAPWLSRLPGLPSAGRKRPWQVAASSR
jgi:hypothetical protein